MAKRKAGRSAARRSPRVGIADTQAKRVYKWQWEWVEFNSNRGLTKNDVREWLEWACKKLKMAPPSRLKIRLLSKKKGHSYFNPDTYELGFIPVHRNVPTVLHEIAHYISFRIYGKTVADHGPEYMGIFLYLLESSSQWPLGIVYQSARKAGLEIDGAQPRRLRK